MRRVASTGHDVSALISSEYIDIQAPRIACDRLILAMFARQGCDKRTLGSAVPHLPLSQNCSVPAISSSDC
jgi:hypothetical protein